MKTNAVPYYDLSDNETGCCPRFDPVGWDDQILHFKDKPFVRAVSKSAMHVPLNMGQVFERVQIHLEDAGALDPENMIILSRDLSPWQEEHLFSIPEDADIEGEEIVTLSGEYLTRVFEGPYREARSWHHQMEVAAKARGRTAEEIYFFYTSCPRCAKAYGENYLVGVAKLSEPAPPS